MVPQFFLTLVLNFMPYTFPLHFLVICVLLSFHVLSHHIRFLPVHVCVLPVSSASISFPCLRSSFPLLSGRLFICFQCSSPCTHSLSIAFTLFVQPVEFVVQGSSIFHFPLYIPSMSLCCFPFQARILQGGKTVKGLLAPLGSFGAADTSLAAKTRMTLPTIGRSFFPLRALPFATSCQQIEVSVKGSGFPNA